MANPRKIAPRYTDHGFGFPVQLRSVPLIQIRGAWSPAIDYSEFAKAVLYALATSGGRLTGDQVRFIRLQNEMTLTEFAERFGVTHPAVLRWERRGELPTGMSWSTEKDIRLSVVSRAGSKALLELYRKLETVGDGEAARVELEGGRVAA